MPDVRIEYTPLGTLVAWPKNPKKHALPGIKKSIQQFGMVAPIILDEASGRVVAGHGRAEALAELKAAGLDPPQNIRTKDGDWLVPVLRGQEFESEDAAQAYLLADNRWSELGGWDATMLEQIQKQIPDDLFALAGFNDAALEELLNDEAKHQAELRRVQFMAAAVDDIPEPPKKSVSKAGDIWVLGEHRLLCGSSASEADVARLFGASKARLMATDPPYGVDYSQSKDGIPGSGFKTMAADWGDMEADQLEGPALQTFLESVFKVALPYLDAAAWYLWHAHLTQCFFSAAAAAADVLLHRQIIWKKTHFVLARSGQYHQQHEPCFYGWVRGQQPRWLAEANLTSVWEVDYDARGKRVHPTQKPVALFEIPIRNHLLLNEVAYEPFAGSGSQVIAAERLGRRCFAVEVAPAYCDVIVERWEKLTGGKATRDAGT